MRRAHIAASVTFIIIASIVIAVPAQATGAARTFVSAAGSDSNNCTNVATPCRHLAAAFFATAANGEIYVLDPANYGSLTITHAVSIEGHGWASIAPVSGGNAITVNANPGDAINIIGVVLDGTALANTNGIQFNSGGSLTVRDSVIRNFTGRGIDFEPNANSNLAVSVTIVANNGGDGILVKPTGSGAVTAIFNRVEADNNGTGIFVAASNPETLNATVTDSVAAGNSDFGFGVSANPGNATTNLMIMRSAAANNAVGIEATGALATLWIGQSAITGNGTDWESFSGGTVQSYLNNQNIGNANTQGPIHPITGGST